MGLGPQACPGDAQPRPAGFLRRRHGPGQPPESPSRGIPPSPRLGGGCGAGGLHHSSAPDRPYCRSLSVWGLAAPPMSRPTKPCKSPRNEKPFRSQGAEYGERSTDGFFSWRFPSSKKKNRIPINIAMNESTTKVLFFFKCALWRGL